MNGRKDRRPPRPAPLPEDDATEVDDIMADRTTADRTVVDAVGPERTVVDAVGPERTVVDAVGPERTVIDRTAAAQRARGSSERARQPARPKRPELMDPDATPIDEPPALTRPAQGSRRERPEDTEITATRTSHSDLVPDLDDLHRFAQLVGRWALRLGRWLYQRVWHPGSRWVITYGRELLIALGWAGRDEDPDAYSRRRGQQWKRFEEGDPSINELKEFDENYRRRDDPPRRR